MALAFANEFRIHHGQPALRPSDDLDSRAVQGMDLPFEVKELFNRLLCAYPSGRLDLDSDFCCSFGLGHNKLLEAYARVKLEEEYGPLTAEELDKEPLRQALDDKFHLLNSADESTIWASQVVKLLKTTGGVAALEARIAEQWA